MTLPLIALVDGSSKMAGVQFSTLYLAQHIDLTRFRVVVVCPDEGDPRDGLPARCRAAGIPVEILPAPRFMSTSIEVRRTGRAPINLPNPISWGVNGGNLIAMARRHAALYRRLGASLIVTKSVFGHLYGVLGARLAGRPAVIHMQDLLANPAYIRVFGGIARLAAHIIADGSPIRDQLAPFVGTDRVTLIYNGVDLDQFSDSTDGKPVRAEWGVQPDECLIGSVARLTAWKGQDVLLRAFSALSGDYPRAKLVLVGSPVFHGEAFEADLRRMVDESGLRDRVIFAGFRWDLPAVLAALDIFAYPSINKDTSPLSVVSALASGRAILVTDVDGVAELFAPEVDGLIVRADDAGALAAGLRRLLDDADLRARLGRAARAKAESGLSLSAYARACEAVFARVLRT
jgi:glycosyltransferase involved in cell wall biosynthesis